MRLVVRVEVIDRVSVKSVTLKILPLRFPSTHKLSILYRKLIEILYENVVRVNDSL